MTRATAPVCDACLCGHSQPDQQDHQGASGGREPEEGPGDAGAGDPARQQEPSGVDEGDADSRQDGREPQAEGGDQHQAECDLPEGDRAQQQHERRWAGTDQPARDAESQQASPRDPFARDPRGQVRVPGMGMIVPVAVAMPAVAGVGMPAPAVGMRLLVGVARVGVMGMRMRFTPAGQQQPRAAQQQARTDEHHREAGDQREPWVERLRKHELRGKEGSAARARTRPAYGWP